VVNAQGERPRKGTFEVKAAGEVVVSLVGMPRPFKPLRALDLDELAGQVVAAMASGEAQESQPNVEQDSGKPAATESAQVSSSSGEAESELPSGALPRGAAAEADTEPRNGEAEVASASG